MGREEEAGSSTQYFGLKVAVQQRLAERQLQAYDTCVAPQAAYCGVCYSLGPDI